MKLFANENSPTLAVEGMRDAGHDVLWARTDTLGASDDEILHRAQEEGRLVLTFDKDFGKLAFRWGIRENEFKMRRCDSVVGSAPLGLVYPIVLGSRGGATFLCEARLIDSALV